MRFRIFLRKSETTGEDEWSEDRFCCENISCSHYSPRNGISAISLVVVDGREFCSEVCARRYSEDNGKGLT